MSGVSSVVLAASKAGAAAWTVVATTCVVGAVLLVKRAWSERLDSVGPGAERASAGARFGAWALDVAAGFLLVFSVLWFAVLLGAWADSTQRLSLTIGNAAYGLVIAVWVLDFALLQGVTGRTLGKQLFGVRTVRGGGAPGLIRAALRSVFIFPLFGPLGATVEAFATAANPEDRRLGDRLAGTSVVRHQPAGRRW